MKLINFVLFFFWTPQLEVVGCVSGVVSVSVLSDISSLCSRSMGVLHHMLGKVHCDISVSLPPPFGYNFTLM